MSAEIISIERHRTYSREDYADRIEARTHAEKIGASAAAIGQASAILERVNRAVSRLACPGDRLRALNAALAQIERLAGECQTETVLLIQRQLVRTRDRIARRN